MKRTFELHDFRREFETSETYKNNFTYEGQEALFNYIEDYEESTGEEMELDIVALCCEFTEYEDFEEIKENYLSYFEENNIETVEDLEEHTSYCF